MLGISVVEAGPVLDAVEGWADRYPGWAFLLVIISSHRLDDVYTVDIAILTILYVH